MMRRLKEWWKKAVAAVVEAHQRGLVSVAVRPAINEQIEAAEARLLAIPQVQCPLVHKFAPGVYLREITMPAGTFIIGHEHVTEHFNIVLSGRARVMIDGKVEEIVAPCTFASKPGVRKVLYILEEMRWATVHPTLETDVERLEEQLVKPSKAWLEAHEMRELTGGHDV